MSESLKRRQAENLIGMYLHGHGVPLPPGFVQMMHQFIGFVVEAAKEELQQEKPAR